MNSLTNNLVHGIGVCNNLTSAGVQILGAGHWTALQDYLIKANDTTEVTDMINYVADMAEIGEKLRTILHPVAMAYYHQYKEKVNI